MKHLSNILFIALAVIFFSCNADDEASMSKIGYLRLGVSESNEVTTKAEDTYHPEVFSVTIKNKETEEVKEFKEWSKDETKVIELAAGTYTISASSANFDNESGFDKPYYAGTKDVTISADKESTETLTCTLANVKVSVVFAEDLLEKYADRDITVIVGDKGEKYTPLTFSKAKCGKEVQGYFPVADLTAEISISRPSGETGTYTMSSEITGVKAKQYYILTYQTENAGDGDFSVKYDPTLNQYNYVFKVNPVAKNTALLSVNPWAKFAYLKAESVTTVDNADLSSLTFQYRAEGEDVWKDVAATAEGEDDAKVYTATATGLTANTAYEYRLVNADESFEVTGSKFTTEGAAQLSNASFEDWCVRSAGTVMGNKDTSFPCSEKDYDAGNLFWDTSNRGANSAGQKDPTNKATDLKKSGTYSAKLQSIEIDAVIIKAFAAASLYTGSFGGASLDMSATVNFGRSFASRPLALHGYYKYTPATVDNVDESLPEDATVAKGKPDECSIYVALTKKTYSVNNKQESTFIDFEGDTNVIAYGELPSGAATEGDGLVEFNIPLKYKNLTDTPSYIIVVCSSSKYGDYFTGGNGSTMYVDDFSLIYDGEPQIWDLSANN